MKFSFKNKQATRRRSPIFNANVAEPVLQEPIQLSTIRQDTLENGSKTIESSVRVLLEARANSRRSSRKHSGKKSVKSRHSISPNNKPTAPGEREASRSRLHGTQVGRMELDAGQLSRVQLTTREEKMISMRDFLINVEDRERSVSREKGKEGKTSVRLLQKQIYLGQQGPEAAQLRHSLLPASQPSSAEQFMYGSQIKSASQIAYYSHSQLSAQHMTASHAPQYLTVPQLVTAPQLSSPSQLRPSHMLPPQMITTSQPVPSPQMKYHQTYQPAPFVQPVFTNKQPISQVMHPSISQRKHQLGLVFGIYQINCFPNPPNNQNKQSQYLTEAKQLRYLLALLISNNQQLQTSTNKLNMLHQTIHNNKTFLQQQLLKKTSIFNQVLKQQQCKFRSLITQHFQAYMRDMQTRMQPFLKAIAFAKQLDRKVTTLHNTLRNVYQSLRITRLEQQNLQLRIGGKTEGVQKGFEDLGQEILELSSIQSYDSMFDKEARQYCEGRHMYNSDNEMQTFQKLSPFAANEHINIVPLRSLIKDPRIRRTDSQAIDAMDEYSFVEQDSETDDKSLLNNYSFKKDKALDDSKLQQLLKRFHSGEYESPVHCWRDEFGRLRLRNGTFILDSSGAVLTLSIPLYAKMIQLHHIVPELPEGK